MASLPPSSKPPKRRPSLRGLLQMDVVNGALRARKWPRKRNKPKTKEEEQRQRDFRAAQQATKYFQPQLYLDAINAVAGTPLLPRDIMTMQLYNRLCMFILPGGKEFWPMTALFDVSRALDILTAVPGSKLIRGPEYWMRDDSPPPPITAVSVAIATRATDIFLPSGAVRNVPMDNATHDPHGWFDPVSGGFKPTVPGYYMFNTRLRGNTPWVNYFALRKNGVDHKPIGTDTGGALWAGGGSCLAEANGTTDYFNLAANILNSVTVGSSQQLTYFEITGPY